MIEEPGSRRNGFTVLEVAVSSTVLGLILIAGTQMAAGALEATSTDVTESDQSARLSRSTDGVLDAFAGTGVSSLWGVPLDGQASEPMLEDVAYQRMTFRKPVGYVEGKVVYDPPVGETPHEMYFEDDGGSVENTSEWGTDWGTLYAVLGGAKKKLRSAVQDVTFAREGNVLLLSFVTLRDDEHKKIHVTRKIYLHAR